MPPRHSDFHPGTVGRYPAANFDQCPSNGLMRRPYRLPPLDAPSPQTDSSFSPPTPVRCITPPQTESLLEKHAISSYAAKKTQLPLSVYELPTATYMWARWTPKEEPRSPEPVIYVKYRPPQSDVDSSSGYSSPPSRSSSQTYSSQPSPESTPPRSYYSRKRCSSAETDDDESASSPSDRFLKHPRFSHNNAPRRAISARSASPPTLPEPPSYQLRPVDRAEASVSHRYGVESDYSDVEMRPARHPHPGHQSNSSSGGGAILAQSMAPAAVPAFAAPRADPEDDRKSTAWTEWTHPSPETSTGTDFECTWVIEEKGTTRRCGYSSKKHLVKRHIESKHLQLRPCKCHFCGKGFAQKSNLDTHLNTHTGLAPHQCIYCSERFKDPARRHRHMIQMHSHQSSRTKKNRMPFHNDGGAASSAETSEHDAEDLTTDH
ncbi:hypothetical protein C8T65DRAFT_742783 [Cerioporus squamosus]|nr:hypothetical protein C8T65DRAFT_742783 [Cerioporus squamosus]